MKLIMIYKFVSSGIKCVKLSRRQCTILSVYIHMRRSRTLLDCDAQYRNKECFYYLKMYRLSLKWYSR